MALPTTGAITLGQVAAELNIALPLTLGDSRVRALAGKPSGAISLGDLRGKSAAIMVLINPPLVEGQGFGQPSTFETVSGSAAVSVQGGTAPFSASWLFTGGDGGISVSGGMNPTFSTSALVPFMRSATFLVTVTDAASKTGQLEISVQLSSGYGMGGV